MELKADAGALTEARIIETRTDGGFGKLATMVIQKGTLKKGDHLLCGCASTRVGSI